MAHDIFISYSHKDKTTADAICSVMESRGIRCWYAPRDIEPGDEWAGAIIRALSASQVMILIFTDFSNVSRQVLREVNNAVSYGVTIVPFRLTDNEPTDQMKYYLATLHWLDALNEPLMESIERLYSHVSAYLQKTREEPGGNVSAVSGRTSERTPNVEEQKEKEASGNQTREASSRKKSLSMAVLGASVLILVLVAGIFLGKKQSAPKPEESEPIAAADVKPEEAEEVEEVTEGTDAEEDSGVEEDSGADEGLSGANSAGGVRKTGLDEDDDSPGAENYLYTIEGNTVMLDKYFGEDESVVTVPEKIDGCTVTQIGDQCFYKRKEIKEVILPETISVIKYQAFRDCLNLSSINLPDSLTNIGGWAFAGTGFSEVTLPDSLVNLGYGAFNGCTHLETVVVSEKMKTINEDTFRSCPVLKQVTIPNPDIEIHAKAFNEDTDLTICGVKGSYCEPYCKAMSLKFQPYEP